MSHGVDVLGVALARLGQFGGGCKKLLRISVRVLKSKNKLKLGGSNFFKGRILRICGYRGHLSNRNLKNGHLDNVVMFEQKMGTV